VDPKDASGANCPGARRKPSLGIVEISRGLILDAVHIKTEHTLLYTNPLSVVLAFHENAIVGTTYPEYQMGQDSVNVE
jgi:hypothetical protein